MLLLLSYRSMLVQLKAVAEYSRCQTLQGQDGEDDELVCQSTEGHFATQPPIHVISGEDVDFESWFKQLSEQSDNFCSKGSGYSLDAIKELNLVVYKYNPLVGSTYVKTPEFFYLTKIVQ